MLKKTVSEDCSGHSASQLHPCAMDERNHNNPHTQNLFPLGRSRYPLTVNIMGITSHPFQVTHFALLRREGRFPVYNIIDSHELLRWTLETVEKNTQKNKTAR